jgi:hypothetical protein
MKETKKARKRTRKDPRSFLFTFCGPTVFDVKYLARYFKVHLKAALNPEDRLLENRKHLIPT